MKISEKRKKWLTKRTLQNCVLVSIGLLTISYLFEFTRMIISTEFSFFPIKILFSVIELIVLVVWIWVLGFLFPENMETVFDMLSFKGKEEDKNEQKS